MISLADQIATPAIWTPGMDVQEWGLALEQQAIRALAEKDLLEGRISYAEFEEVLDATGIDPIAAHRDWSSGISYVPGGA